MLCERLPLTRDSGQRFTLSRDELLTLPEFVLLSLFPNGLLPDGHMNSYHDGDVYSVDVRDTRHDRPLTQLAAQSPATVVEIKNVICNTDVYLSDILYHSQYDPISLQYMLEFFRHVAQTIPQPSEEQPSSDPASPSPMPIEPMTGNPRDMLQDRAGIIVLREDLDFYAIPPRKDIEQTEMISIKRAASRALLKQDGIFSGLRKSEEPGTTEQHLIEMLTAGYGLPGIHCAVLDANDSQRLQSRGHLGASCSRTAEGCHMLHRIGSATDRYQR